MTLSSEVQDATLRRLRSALANGDDAGERQRPRAMPRRSFDAKALAKQVIRRGIAWYVDAAARAAAREAADALYQRISIELLRSGSQEDPRVLAVNQELSLVVLSNASAHDPTRPRLLHPSVLAFLCERAAFDTVELRYFAPSVDDELPLITTDGAPQWVDEINESLTRLNEVLFGPPEYAVVARVSQA